MSVGKKIRALRRAKGWSQDQLAEAAGVKANYISMIETGQSKPSKRVQAAIFVALGAEDRFAEFDRKVAELRPQPEDEAALINTFRCLTRSQRQLALRLLAVLAEGEAAIAQPAPAPIQQIPTQTEERRVIRLVGIVAAGKGWSNIERQGEDLWVPTSVLGKLKPEATWAVRVDGDSMLPDICDGCYVLFGKTQARVGQIAVIETELGRAYVKRIAKWTEEEAVLESLNSAYHPIIIRPGRDVLNAARVLQVYDARRE